MSKTAVLFDFDGVIADTEASNASYLAQAMDQYGVHMTEADKRAIIGTNGVDTIRSLLAQARVHVSIEEFQKTRERMGSTYENAHLQPMPGLLPLIFELRRNKIMTGIVSSTSTKFIITALNRMHMTSLFDCIICGDMCRNKKPNPEGYKKAMNFLSVSPGSSIIFEDSRTGIQAGKAAGCCVIAYRGADEEQDVSAADYICDTFAEGEKLVRYLYDNSMAIHC